MLIEPFLQDLSAACEGVAGQVPPLPGRSRRRRLGGAAVSDDFEKSEE